MVIDVTLQTKKTTSSDGIVRYVKDKKLHNSEGPAIIYPNGKEEYYVNGIKYDKKTFLKTKKDTVGLPYYKKAGSNSRF